VKKVSPPQTLPQRGRQAAIGGARKEVRGT
jgi:hypothetical protein